MRHSTPSPTAKDVQRFDQIREHGCIACRMRGAGKFWPEIHHLGVTGRHGGKRRGHAFTVGLCPWHHRGAHPREIHLPVADLEAWLGPSLKLHARRFRETFGEDGPLLEYQNKLLGVVTPACAPAIPRVLPRRLTPA